MLAHLVNCPSSRVLAVFDEQVTVATLNTRGVAVVGTHLAGRFAVIGAEVEVGNADVACFQEVFTWWHLRLLARRMPSKFHDHRSAALYGHHVTLLPVETLLCLAASFLVNHPGSRRDRGGVRRWWLHCAHV